MITRRELESMTVKEIRRTAEYVNVTFWTCGESKSKLNKSDLIDLILLNERRARDRVASPASPANRDRRNHSGPRSATRRPNYRSMTDAELDSVMVMLTKFAAFHDLNCDTIRTRAYLNAAASLRNNSDVLLADLQSLDHIG